MSVNLNGDLSQWTLGTSFAACASGQMTADCFRLHDTSAAVHTVRQSTEVPHRDIAGRIIPYSLEVEVTTADTSIGSSDVTAIIYRGEGSELCYLGENSIRVRGWIFGPAGSYNLHLSNGPETLSYSQPLLLNSSSMWTRFDAWFPKVPDFDGSWYLDNRVGYTIALTLCAGSGLQDEMETWVSGLKFGAGQTNFNATVGNKFRLAGLRVGDGTLVYQSAEAAELYCMRYLGKSFGRGQAPVSALGTSTGESMGYALISGASIQSLPVNHFTVPMRKAPALTGYNPGGAGSQARTLVHGDCTLTTFDSITTLGFRAYATLPASATAGEVFGLHWLADASLPALTTNIGG